MMKANPCGGTAPPPFLKYNSSALQPEAVDIPVACQLLGLGRTKLYELLGNGTLPSVKIGRRRLVRLETARQVLASLEHAGIERRVA